MKAPKLPFGFVRSKQPKRFDYSPMYYDERKERLEERRKILTETYQKEKNLTEKQKNRVREISSAEWRKPIHRRQSYLQTMRFFLILLSICILFSWIIFKIAIEFNEQ